MNDSITSQVERLIAATRALIAVVEQENKLLEAHEYKAIKPLLDRKVAAADTYEALYHTVLRDVDGLATINADLRAELRQQIETLTQHGERNRHLLSAAADANDMMIKSIVRAASNATQRVNGYTAEGTSYSQAPRHDPLSVTLNRTT